MKITQICALTALAVSLATPSLVASTITLNLDPVNFTALPGGEYNAVPAGTLVQPVTLLPYAPGDILAGYAASAKSGGGFQTFCLEENESFTPGKSYFTAINTGAVGGGVNLGHPGITPGFDPLSQGTSWLYSQFAKGTLAGYNYTYGAGRIATAKELQQTIWWLEDESSVAPANVFTTAVYAQFLDPKKDAVAGEFGVWALNLTLRDGTRRQDVPVYLTPDGGFTLVFLGFGLGGLSLLSRRVQVSR